MEAAQKHRVSPIVLPTPPHHRVGGQNRQSHDYSYERIRFIPLCQLALPYTTMKTDQARIFA